MILIHTNTAAYMYDQLPRNVYKCTSPMTNYLLLISLTRIFYKNSSASLDRISISELCSAINSTVTTVHENFTSQH